MYMYVHFLVPLSGTIIHFPARCCTFRDIVMLSLDRDDLNFMLIIEAS